MTTPETSRITSLSFEIALHGKTIPIQAIVKLRPHVENPNKPGFMTLLDLIGIVALYCVKKTDGREFNGIPTPNDTENFLRWLQVKQLIITNLQLKLVPLLAMGYKIDPQIHHVSKTNRPRNPIDVYLHLLLIEAAGGHPLSYST